MTPGFILLSTALTSLVGGLLIMLALFKGIRRDLVIMSFDLLTSIIILISILYTESKIPVSGVIASLPLFTLLNYLSYEILITKTLWTYLIILISLSRFYYSFRSFYRAWRLGKGIVLGIDSTLIQLALVALIAIVSGASVVYIAESSDPRSHIKTFGDALWWAISTATTVGYGDIVPMTRLGRITASMLMVVGIGSLGIFISDMAVRVAKILMVEDFENMPVLEREKRKIIKMISKIEELSDEELEALLRKIKVLHILSRAGNEDNLLEVIIDNRLSSKSS
jgi:voltage-gated potassium channel Kch